MTFLEFCRDHGIVIDSTPPFAVWRRYPTVDKPGKRNGAVKFLGDHGFCQNHATEHDVSVWREDGASVHPRRREQIKRDASARMAAERKRRIRARAAMAERWHSFPPLRDGHPYLERKGLPMMGCGNLRVDGDKLVVPMYDIESNPFSTAPHLLSFQTITPDGEKKYYPGCSTKGAHFPLIRKHGVVTCFAEGFATGLAVYQSMPNATVIVCFDAGNMVRIARHAKPKGLAVVVADNDWETALKPNMNGRNPGIEKGSEAAAAIGCGFAFPQGIKGSDWADALQEWGERGPAMLRLQIMRYAKVSRSG